MLSKFAKAFGAVFLLIGVLGFIPAFTPDNNLLGIFHVDAMHNLIHLASGVVALLCGFAGDRASRRYFQIFGIVYGLVAVLGFISMDHDILGMVANNMADNLLHVVIAGTSLYLGFAYGKHDGAAVNA
jgi:hypothetical protein